MCIYIVYISGSLWNFCVGVLWSRPPFGLLSLPVTSSSSEPLTLLERNHETLLTCLSMFVLFWLIHVFKICPFCRGLLFFFFMYSSTSFHVHTELSVCSLALSCTLWAALQEPSLHRHLWYRHNLLTIETLECCS